MAFFISVSPSIDRAALGQVERMVILRICYTKGLKMTDVIIPLDLFDDLIDNTIECMNAAKNSLDEALVMEYKKDIDRCREIQKELSKDY